MAGVSEVTDATFESQVIDSDKPTVVDFWAPWCMPCKMLSPILDSVAQNKSDTYNFFKMNTDKNQAVASKFGIMSIPSLVVFRGGKEIHRMIGVKPAEVLEKELNNLLQGSD